MTAIGLLAALLVALPSAAAAEPTLGQGDVGPRTVRYTYQARITPPAGAQVVEMWMPLPREEDQAVLALRLEGTGHPTVIRVASAGDRAAYLRVERPAGTVSMTQTATVARREVSAAVPAARAATLTDIDVKTYASELGATPAVSINDEVRAIAARETRGKDTVVARARALYDWVFAHMQYDKSVPGWGLGDIPYCLKIGKGNCTDFHTLFMALARASGIPARWNIGFPLAYGNGVPTGNEVPISGYHCWAEFYAPGAGWVPVDISEARKHPELKDYFFGTLSGNRLLFTRGRDLVLEPAGDGKPLNYFIYPVARADGRDVGPVEWTFRYTDAPVIAAR